MPKWLKERERAFLGVATAAVVAVGVLYSSRTGWRDRGEREGRSSLAFWLGSLLVIGWNGTFLHYCNLPTAQVLC